jgi:hypothetical protein
MKNAHIAALLGLGMIATAGAQTEIRITGSTAFRSAVHSAIIAKMSENSGTYTYGYTGPTLDKAGQAIFKGTINGNSVTVLTGFSGSAAGIRDVAQGNTVNFLPTSSTTSAGGTASLSSGTYSAVPHAALSDVFQSSTIYTSPTLVDNQLCVVPFRWIANMGAGIDNMTPGLVQKLYKNGQLPLAQFTGSSADSGKLAVAIGRDPESGTRITATAESGLGAFATCLQFSVTATGSTFSSANIAVWPETSTYVEGNNGYDSGGKLVGALQKTSTDGTVLIGYAGLSDSKSAISGGTLVELKWNGVPYSAANVQEGKYSFWCYEHLFYKSDLTGTTKTVVDAIGTQTGNNPGDAGLTLSSMHASRVGDGAPVDSAY